MDVIVMAGGRGTRLWPLTAEQPKPLVPIANRPVLSHVFDLLRTHELNQAVLTLGYKGEHITQVCGDGSGWGLHLRFAYEEEPLGTAGGVLNAVRALDLSGPILVISGDALTDMDLGALLRFHQVSGAMATMALAEVEDPRRYGVVETGEGGRIHRFIEKPRGMVPTHTVNTGIYVLEPEILERIPPDAPYDFGRDLFPALLAADAPLFGWRNESYWCDVGTLESYIQANIDAAAGRVRVSLGGRALQQGVHIEDDAELGTGAQFSPPVVVGRGSRIGHGATLNEVSVGHGARVGAGSILRRVVLLDGGEVEAGQQLSDAIVGVFGCVRYAELHA